jgi:hypothetical protein
MSKVNPFVRNAVKKINCGIAIVEHLPSGKLLVIGSTDLRRQIATQHAQLKKGTHHNIDLQNDWNASSEDDWDWEPLIVCQSDDVKAMRDEYIRQYRKTHSLYNQS